MKNSSSSSSRDRVGEALVALQDDGGFEGVADQFFLARLFDCLADDAAESQQLLDFLPNDGVLQFALRFGKQLQVDGVRRCRDNPTLPPR